MTLTQDVAPQKLMAPSLPDTTVNTDTAGAERQAGSQWRYASAIEAARALNAGMKGR